MPDPHFSFNETALRDAEREAMKLNQTAVGLGESSTKSSEAMTMQQSLANHQRTQSQMPSGLTLHLRRIEEAQDEQTATSRELQLEQQPTSKGFAPQRPAPSKEELLRRSELTLINGLGQ